MIVLSLLLERTPATAHAFNFYLRIACMMQSLVLGALVGAPARARVFGPSLPAFASQSVCCGQKFNTSTATFLLLEGRNRFDGTQSCRGGCGMPLERAWPKGNRNFLDAGVPALELEFEAAPVCWRERPTSACQGVSHSDAFQPLKVCFCR
jgi:hypothetical protein